MSEDNIDYVVKQASQIVGTPIIDKKSYQSKYNEDFQLASFDYWNINKPQMVTKYMAGKIVGNYGHDKSRLKDYLKSVFSMIKESVMIQLSNNGYVGNELKTQFVILESCLDLIYDTIVRVDSDKRINVDELVSFMHGFVNSYVEKTKREDSQNG